MTAKPSLPKTALKNESRSRDKKLRSNKRSQKQSRRNHENSDVLVSAVISTYLLTHLHHVLQRAEYAALKDGRPSQAANFAQLRKVLCMDARSMEDASALFRKEEDSLKRKKPQIESNAA